MCNSLRPALRKKTRDDEEQAKGALGALGSGKLKGSQKGLEAVKKGGMGFL